MPSPVLPSKTVVVLGASYGGARAARLLSLSLPHGWRLIVIDRNSHMNHVYVFPRFTILPEHAPKAYVPYTHLLAPPPSAAPRRPPLPARKSTIIANAARPNTLGKISASRPITPPLTPTGSDSDEHEHGPASDSDESESSSSSSSSRVFIQASVTSLSANSVTFTRALHRKPSDGLFSGLSTSHSSTNSLNTLASVATTGTAATFDGPEETVYFDYCIYALGSGMPDPVNVWSEHPNMPQDIVHDHRERGLGTKRGGIRWMQRKAEHLRRAQRIVIVGGGALGIQFASDLKEVYPDKRITLLHSRKRLMPLYPESMHDAIIAGLEKLGVEVVLGERVTTWPEEPERLDGRTKVVRTDKGGVYEADLVLPCTGQKPHVSFMADLSPSSISKTTSRIRVRPTMQVSNGPSCAASSSSSVAASGQISQDDTPTDRLAGLSLGAAPPTPPASAGDERPPHGFGNRRRQPNLDHMFAVGDCAETGAIQAGHTAYWQAEVAARNILRLIERERAAHGEQDVDDEGVVDEERRKMAEEPLEDYKPGPPAIKVSLGLKNGVVALGDDVKLSDEGVEDLQARLMWPMLQAQDCADDE